MARLSAVRQSTVKTQSPETIIGSPVSAAFRFERLPTLPDVPGVN